MKNSFLLASSIFFVSSLIAQKKYDYDFQNPSLPVEKRVNDLVSRLTLEEKVSQMLHATPAIDRLGIPAYDWWNECLNGVAGTKFDPKYLKAAACAKHYAIHSGPEPSRHVFDVNVSDHDLWDTYLPAFKALVVDAKVAGVMCAYNAYAGQPCCGSDKLMIKILRDDWKFAG